MADTQLVWIKHSSSLTDERYQRFAKPMLRNVAGRRLISSRSSSTKNLRDEPSDYRARIALVRHMHHSKE
jgi:hypothetical protein